MHDPSVLFQLICSFGIRIRWATLWQVRLLGSEAEGGIDVSGCGDALAWPHFGKCGYLGVGWLLFLDHLVHPVHLEDPVTGVAFTKTTRENSFLLDS